MKRMVLKTPAKINLALDVVGKRADGYHTLETVFQTVSLYDTITVTLFPHRTGEQAIRILCNIPWIPKDERNIAWKAVDLFLKKTGCPVGFDIYLQKYIPSQAGLGGGSSDAAAVLYACNQLTGAGLSHAELCEMGLQLGADVPFFFYGGTAYAAGIGEEIQPLPYLGDVSVVLAKGKGGISTAAAYGCPAKSATSKCSGDEAAATGICRTERPCTALRKSICRGHRTADCSEVATGNARTGSICQPDDGQRLGGFRAVPLARTCSQMLFGSAEGCSVCGTVQDDSAYFLCNITF